MARVLVVDDDAGQRTILASILAAAGHEVSQAASAADASAGMSQVGPSVVLTDLRMPGGTGLGVVEQAARLPDGPEVVVMTAYGSVETAVKALKLGAYDYLTKPLDREEILVVVDRADQKYRLRCDSRRLRESLAREAEEGLVAESDAMRAVLETVRRVAPTDATVLIRGESGTGKERVARLIHFLSPRGTKPFQALNCAAFPEGLLESELFGHERGAFTGASSRRVGLVEAASGGTLFLDEIGDMALATQAKVLRVLQDREIRRVGSNDTVRVDVRFVAATNRDLQEAMRNGTFREDLFYRLNIVPIVIPPLRERRGDIVALVHRCLTSRTPRKEITSGAMEQLTAYSWPGNVRELQAVIDRISILVPGNCIDTIHLPPEVTGPTAPTGPGQASTQPFMLPAEGVDFDVWERELLRQALARANGVMTEAAKLLRMTYRTFQYRAEKFGLTDRQ